MKKIVTLLFILTNCFISVSAITVRQATGNQESITITWDAVTDAALYEVYYSGEGVENKKTDCQLIRQYQDYWRADILGLKAGNYSVKVTAVNSNGQLLEYTTLDNIIVEKYKREGFAFTDGNVPGAYNLDGTLKEDARVIYLWKDNANTVETDIVYDAKSRVKTAVGVCDIMKIIGYGYDHVPTAIRIIGSLSAEDVSGLNKLKYIELTGANNSNRMIENITVEGVGDDATMTGGIAIHLKRSKNIEVRNIGFMLFADDGVSMENDNSYIWVHNNDFFYGAVGSASDKKKGDGSIDMKYETTNITISYNHFWDSGKTTFAGGEKESGPIYFTYCGNWFDHADSRLPRLCHATAHVYNNYYDGNPTMGMLCVEGTSAFSEANYYRNCLWPMMINMQGSNYEKWPDGTQEGGMIKAYNNHFEGNYTLITQKERPADFDAYEVNSRGEIIPESVVCKKGGHAYSNFDTSDLMYEYSPIAPEDVKDDVMKYAGRVGGGDLKWDFNDSVDDASNSVNETLKAALVGYTSKLVAIQSNDNLTAVRKIFVLEEKNAGTACNLAGQILPKSCVNADGIHIIGGKKMLKGFYK